MTAGVTAVVLAAGQGKRMRSNYPKVIHNVGGGPMLSRVLESAGQAGVDEQVVVVGYGREKIYEVMGDLNYVVQEKQLGTGHAVNQARDVLGGECRDVLVLCGDTPLIRGDTLKALLGQHREREAAATILTAEIADPRGYGRIIRNESGSVTEIVEDADASPRELEIKEVNSGTYIFNRTELFLALENIKPDNVQGEYYLTDVVKDFFDRGKRVEAFRLEDSEEILGINDRVQLAHAEGILRKRKNEELMLAGVTIVDPDTTRIGPHVTAGRDTIIHPFTIIEGHTNIGAECEIGPSAVIQESFIGDRVLFHNSMIVESRLGNNCNVGPFSYIRPGTHVGDNVRIGDFVEIKKSNIGHGSKIPHHSYVGDASIGDNVNIGAGTIFCNYDGANKWQTTVEEGAFIGSNSNLVAPLQIGRGAYIAAGSTITKDVPGGALGVARGRQTNIDNWVNKKMKDT